MKQFHFYRWAVITALSLISHIGYTTPDFSQRPDVKAFIQSMVKQHHFNRQALTQLFNQVQVQPKIIEAISRPYEKKTWDAYRPLFLTTERVQGGLLFWKKNQALLKQAEKQYGVPANIIVAILGVETRYGTHQGDYRVIDALSTLAFDYPPRSPFFKKELSEFLLLCREHHASPTTYLGSYAGAMGKPQFMPSSYRYYAADFLGHPHKDLMHDDQAVIASVANYFRQHGWRSNEPIAQPALLRGYGYKKIDTALKSAAYPIDHLKQVGISPLSLASNEPNKAGLIQLETQSGPEYWMAYPNFYVITRYNTSPQYALVVYLLSEQLKQAWVQETKHIPAHGFG
ncbi:MAG: lytic murein transglycosylase B [Gammaproteobacteria bacterium]|nr:lytic murein transglycosylase B [Gammaproteobacteria bacterium]